MEIRLQRIEEMLGTLIKMVGENNSRLKTLEEKSDRHDSRLESLEKKTDRLESSMQSLEKKTDSLESSMQSLEKKSDKLEMDMKETKDYAKILMEGQERQDRILEMLSVKSIETDSYIRDFKRRL